MNACAKLSEHPGTPVSCNRPAGHDGPHRVVDAYTFAVLAEWTPAGFTIEPKDPPKRGYTHRKPIKAATK